MRLLLPISAFVLATAAAAQTPAPAAAPKREPLEGRTNQRVEYIHHEDAGNRIDEVRYGGETERIVVQPKANVPEYEIQTLPLSGIRRQEAREGLSGAAAPRVWNVLRF